MWFDVIAIACILLIVGGAVAYMLKARKNGRHCIGCPGGCGTSKDKNGCQGCNGKCQTECEDEEIEG